MRTRLIAVLLAVSVAVPVNITTRDGSTVLFLDNVTGDLLSVGAVDRRISLTAGSGSIVSLPSMCSFQAVNVTAQRGWSVIRTFDCTPTSNAGSAHVLVTDTFTDESTYIAWTTSYKVLDTSPAGFIFTFPLGVSLQPTAGAGNLSLWSTWTRGCVQNAGGAPGMCLGEGSWSDPFVPLALPTPVTLFRLGNLEYNAEIMGALGPPIADSFTVPLATFLRPADDIGVTLLLSPDDSLLDVLLRANGSAIDFIRLFQRLDGAAPAPPTFTQYLRAHAADWRPALKLYVDTCIDHVRPSSPAADAFDGLGGYSWQAPLNRSYADSVGFATNWELSGTFMPYDGLFAPYEESWLNLGPINAGLPQYNVTYARIQNFELGVQSIGLNSLTYYDVGNWGVSIDTTRAWPNLTCGVRDDGVTPAPCATPDGSNAYLQHFLQDALLNRGWSPSRGFFTTPFSDWVGTTLMDPSEPAFEGLLVEQLLRRQTRVPAMTGIAIDRFDYTHYYSFKRDDGVSWVPQPGGAGGGWGPAQSLLLSHRHAYARLAGAMRGVNPRAVMLGNCNTVCRVDLGGPAFDGSFNEGAALNAVAWTGLMRPTILWTYSLSDDAATLDAYFQQHLLMRVFPMAPMPGNDHSINPGSAAVTRAYEDYAPLFDAARHLEWALDTPRPVAVLNASAPAPLVNMFSSRVLAAGNLLVAVVLGSGMDAAVALRVAAASGVSAYNASALMPGGGNAWLSLGTAPVVAMTVLVTLPLARGCALLQLLPL